MSGFVFSTTTVCSASVCGCAYAGSFVIIGEAENAKNERITGTISHVLLPEHEKVLRKKPDIW